LVVPTPSSIAVGQAQAPTPQQLSDRRQRSGVQSQLFNDLVDEVFYGRYPQMVGRKLGDEASQRSLREEWLTIATELLTQLETLSPAQRRKLGTYRQGDLDKQLLALQNQKEKLAKIDNQFQRLFPGQTGRSANLKTFGQIWCAIAETSLK
jgi:serine/threonine-protein kinase